MNIAPFPRYSTTNVNVDQAILQPLCATYFLDRRRRHHVTRSAPLHAVQQEQHTSSPTPPAVDHVEILKKELESPRKSFIHIAQLAPSVRVTIGEDLGLPIGISVTKKLVSALRLLGFDYVFDVQAGADLTIMEEATELLHRIQSNGPLPMFTSCCPGWIEFVEHCAPQMIPYISTTKSPHMVSGTLIKEILPAKLHVNERDLSLTSIMPCLKKQPEADRISYQTHTGVRHVDHVLTTRETAALLQQRGIDLMSLPDSEFDDFMGISTGAGAIFGSTGGVMEAALRTFVELAAGRPIVNDRLEYDAIRGLEGVKETSITIPPNPEGPLKNAEPLTVHVAVVNGLANAKKLIAALEKGEYKHLTFIEVMSCPGGCIAGGGQPRMKSKETLQLRQQAIYREDQAHQLRRSHESPVVKEIYSSYLERPGSKRAEELLHTTYTEGGPPKYDITKEPPVPGTCHVPESPVSLADDDSLCEPSSDDDDVHDYVLSTDRPH